MKTTGITRRIDELGRVVIPKEIRKNMHLKTGELLEIYLHDSDTIVLKKHSVINREQEFINNFIKSLSKKINCEIYVTNLNEVVFSSKENLIGEKISHTLENMIGNTINISNEKTLNLTNNITLTDDFKVYPILPNGDFSGLVIFEKSVDTINSELINFSISFLENYLENN